MRNLVACLILCFSAMTAMAGPFDRGGRDDRGGRGGWNDGRGGGGRGGWDNGRGGGREEWRQVDEVHFYDSKTAVAIGNCKRARDTDARCTRSREYQCGLCSENDHSDHSSYLVYQLIGNGGGGGWNPNPPRNERRFVQSFHFTDKKTAIAYEKCQSARSQMRECSDSRRWECTPCTVESHTDHSQFDLYSLGR